MKHFKYCTKELENCIRCTSRNCVYLEYPFRMRRSFEVMSPEHFSIFLTPIRSTRNSFKWCEEVPGWRLGPIILSTWPCPSAVSPQRQIAGKCRHRVDKTEKVIEEVHRSAAWCFRNFSGDFRWSLGVSGSSYAVFSVITFIRSDFLWIAEDKGRLQASLEYHVPSHSSVTTLFAWLYSHSVNHNLTKMSDDLKPIVSEK